MAGTTNRPANVVADGRGGWVMGNHGPITDVDAAAAIDAMPTDTAMRVLLGRYVAGLAAAIETGECRDWADVDQTERLAWMNVLVAASSLTVALDVAEAVA